MGGDLLALNAADLDAVRRRIEQLIDRRTLGRFTEQDAVEYEALAAREAELARRA
jgi:hypothetical protein